MKNELQQTLIDLGFTVRLDKDGNEVADPSKSMKYIIDDDMGLFDNEEFENDIQAYEDATEAIKLPDPVEMWKELSRPSLKFDESYHIYDKYMHFIQTQLTKEMFVNEVEKPKQFEGALEFGVGKDYDDAIEYQKAEEKVLFHGWTKSTNFRSKEILKNTEEEFSFEELGKTIHDLQNNDVQLYLRIN